MPYRIGITCDPNRRRREWQSRYPRSFRDWEILTQFGSKSQAQAYELKFAADHGCTAIPASVGPENTTWYVYRFQYD